MKDSCDTAPAELQNLPRQQRRIFPSRSLITDIDMTEGGTAHTSRGLNLAKLSGSRARRPLA
eukprot:51537-Eustigmatos_ZCMA.PRE.1